MYALIEIIDHLTRVARVPASVLDAASDLAEIAMLDLLEGEVDDVRRELVRRRHPVTDQEESTDETDDMLAWFDRATSELVDDAAHAHQGFLLEYETRRDKLRAEHAYAEHIDLGRDDWLVQFASSSTDLAELRKAANSAITLKWQPCLGELDDAIRLLADLLHVTLATDPDVPFLSHLPGTDEPVPHVTHGMQLRMNATVAAQAASPTLNAWTTLEIRDLLPMPVHAIPGLSPLRYHATSRGNAFVKDLTSDSSVIGEHDYEQGLREVAVCLVAEHLGSHWVKLVAPAVIRHLDGRLVLVSQEQPGRSGMKVRVGEQVREADVDAAALLDYLIDNGDRHSGNYLVTDQGHLKLIDHGMCMEYDNERPRCHATLYESRVNERGHTTLTPAELDAVERLRSALPTLRPLLQDHAYAGLKDRVEQLLVHGSLPR